MPIVFSRWETPTKPANLSSLEATNKNRLFKIRHAVCPYFCSKEGEIQLCFFFFFMQYNFYLFSYFYVKFVPIWNTEGQIQFQVALPKKTDRFCLLFFVDYWISHSLLLHCSANVDCVPVSTKCILHLFVSSTNMKLFSLFGEILLFLCYSSRKKDTLWIRSVTWRACRCLRML